MAGQWQKPLIGITLVRDYETDRFWLMPSYCRCIEAAGGIPVMIPPLDGGAGAAEILGRLQGLLLSGGGDVAPLFYGTEPRPGLDDVDPQRDEWEIGLAREALERDLPLLGICRGLQLLNVAAGGTLIQDLTGPGLLQHRQKAPPFAPSHSAAVFAGTRLAALLGEGHLAVNSFHHQAAGAVAPGLIVSAAAPDGVVEALESPAHRFALAVQWHPEALDHPASRSLFSAFVKRATG
jgi:putative glutamine amidotransferase